ncbi:MAG: inositol oxygenase family protein [Candidatus Babeliales bacterium]
MKKIALLFSVHFVLGAQQQELRIYPQDPAHKVYQHYWSSHTQQTVEYVKKQHERFVHSPDYLSLSVQEAFALLQSFVDPSDPDVEFANSIHNFQTAEVCRKLLPDCDWFHLVGLIHDIGKVLYYFDEPTWAIVGDTFPVGHPFSPACIYYDFFKENPDFAKPSIYQKHCGFDNVYFSWGHDEYLYHVLKASNTKLPDEALYIIRYHSFYPFHHQYGYLDLANEHDITMLGYLKLFNQCDLYSKVDDIIDYASIHHYYDGLIKKYLPEPLKFFKPCV